VNDTKPPPPLLVVNLRGSDAVLFRAVRDAVAERAGCDVTHSAVIRAALQLLAEECRRKQP
jgi:hypothetical protein